jgi:hypothetical protein
MPIVQWSQLRSVLRETLPVLVALWSVCVAMGVGRLLATNPVEGLRLAGHLLGVFTAPLMAFDILQRRRDFGRPSIVAAIRSLFRRAVGAFRKPRNVTLQAAAGVAFSAGGASVMGISSLAAATVEQRVAALERGIQELRAEMRAASDGVSRRIETLERELRRERNERQEGDRRINQRIEDVAVGGIPLEVVALTWVTFATAFNSIPEQIAAALVLR